MKIFLSLLLSFVFLAPVSGVQASTIMDFVKREKKEERKELHSTAPKENFSDDFIISLAEDWKLSDEICDKKTTSESEKFCKKKLLEQKMEMAERQNIFERQKKFLLSEEYCMNRKTFENHTLCNRLLLGQQASCDAQETSGNRIIVDLKNQILYAVKNCQLAQYTRITSGKDETPTPLGSWKIYEARGPHLMQDEWFVERAFYFYGGYAVHDAGWRVGNGWQKNRRALNGSHGCINTPGPVMEKLWDEFGVFDTVDIYDELPWKIHWELSTKTSGIAPYNPLEIQN